MTSDNICDILVPEKKQQSLRHMKNYLITCEYGLSNAAGFERTCCVFCVFGPKCKKMSRISLFWEVFGLCDEKHPFGHD